MRWPHPWEPSEQHADTMQSKSSQMQHQTQTVDIEQTGPAITCYVCRSRYAYLGPGFHEGKCPDCGSTSVSPAGGLTCEDVEEVTPDDADSADRVFHVVATDVTDRRFEWWVVVGDTDALVVRILIEGSAVDLVDATGTDVLPLTTLTEWVADDLDGATLRSFRAGVRD